MCGHAVMIAVMIDICFVHIGNRVYHLRRMLPMTAAQAGVTKIVDSLQIKLSTSEAHLKLKLATAADFKTQSNLLV